jgi:tetratricopeptide (TPR) repeat protein
MNTRRGSDRAGLALALALGLAVSSSGCRARRAPPPPRPAVAAPSVAPLPTATARPTATALPEPSAPSLAPPAPADSLPDHPSAALAAATRITERARRDLDAGRTDQGLELLEQAMQVAPDAPFAYYYMAGVYLQRGRAAEAEVLAQRAATLADGYPAGWSGHAHALRGRALQVLGRTEQAVAAFRAALRADPNNAPAREALQQIGN